MDAKRVELIKYFSYRTGAIDALFMMLVRYEQHKEQSNDCKYILTAQGEGYGITVRNIYPAYDEDHNSLYIDCNAYENNFTFSGYVGKDDIIFNNARFPTNAETSRSVITLCSGAFFFAIAHKKDKIQIEVIREHGMADILNGELHFNEIVYGFNAVGFKLYNHSYTDRAKILNFETIVSKNKIRDIFDNV